MRIHLLILVGIVAGLLSSCGGSGSGVIIKGSFKNLQSGNFFVYGTDASWGSFDTISVSDGDFSMSHLLEDTTVVVLQYPNFMQMYVVAIPGNTVKVSGDANNLLTTRITGCEDNELLTEFRRSIIRKSKGEIIRLAENFIREHPESFAAQAVLQQYFLMAEKPDVVKLQSLVSLMLKKAPERISLKVIASNLRSSFRCSVGKRLPDFKAKTLKGENVSSQSIKGHYALITFWSTWNTSFFAAVQKERKVLKPYLSKLKVVNISLDTDTIETQRIIERDSIPGLNVCDKQAWHSPVVRALGVNRLPLNYYVDPKGKILGSDLKEDDLLALLRKTLDKSDK